MSNAAESTSYFSSRDTLSASGATGHSVNNLSVSEALSAGRNVLHRVVRFVLKNDLLLRGCHATHRTRVSAADVCSQPAVFCAQKSSTARNGSFLSSYALGSPLHESFSPAKEALVKLDNWKVTLIWIAGLNCTFSRYLCNETVRHKSIFANEFSEMYMARAMWYRSGLSTRHKSS